MNVTRDEFVKNCNISVIRGKFLQRRHEEPCTSRFDPAQGDEVI